MRVTVDRDRLAAAIVDHLLGDHHKKPWMPVECADMVLKEAGGVRPAASVGAAPLRILDARARSTRKHDL